jgi:hypothetical protein
MKHRWSGKLAQQNRKYILFSGLFAILYAKPLCFYLTEKPLPAIVYLQGGSV